MINQLMLNLYPSHTHLSILFCFILSIFIYLILSIFFYLCLSIIPWIYQQHYLVVGNLASCHFDGGKMDAAVRSYKHAIQLEPNFPDAYNNLGNAQVYKKQI